MLDRLRTAFSALTLLHKTLLVSALLHGALLTVRFVDPEGFNRFFQDTPLEVVLVNAASEDRPDKAQALAQANLTGGGDADKGRATSPLPPSPHSELGDSLEDTRRMIEQMQAEQQQLLTMVRNELAALPPPQPRPTAQASPEARAEQERRKQLTNLLAEIEKRVREENARPKKRYLSPATLKSADALYYSHFRTQVERSGTRNFPTHKGRKLYGDLVMEVWLNRQGEVIETVVTRSSGDPLLDKRAASIVRKAGPFGVIPDEVRAGHDLVLISSRFRFTREAGLEATTQATTLPMAAP